MLDFVLARRRTLIAAFAAGAVTVLVVHPTLARAIGADVWNVPALTEQVRAAEAEQSRLSVENDEVLHRIAVKDAIVADLTAGRITLAEATDQFTVLNASRPQYMDVIRRTVSGATEREKLARNVIAYALPRIPPTEQSAAASRLETELRHLLASDAPH